MRFLASYVMSGQIQALSAAVLMGIISLQLLPAALLCTATIGLYLLRKGHKSTLPIFFGTIFLVYIGSLFLETRPGLSFPLAIIVMIPTVVSAQILRATQSQGIAVSFAVCCAALFAISIQLYSGDAIEWWSSWLKTVILGRQNAGYEDFVVSGDINIMNGMVATLLALCTILSLFISRWLQSLLYNPGGFSLEFNNLIIPKSVLIIISIMVLISAVISNNLLNDLLMVFSVIYFFQGLAILHFHINKKNLSNSWLFPVYLIIFFLPHYAIIGLAGAGIMDTFLNFRKLAI